MRMNLSGVEVASALVVVAHPDDAEFGAGGTIARMAAEGAEVTICVVSNGAMGANDPHVAPAALLMTASNPDCYIDISAHMDTKIRALRAHVSQLGAYEGLGDRVREMAKLTAEQGGTGTEYAEAFKAFFFEQRPSAQGDVKP